MKKCLEKRRHSRRIGRVYTQVADEESGDDTGWSQPVIGTVTTMTSNLTNECAICLEHFNTGQQIRVLDCGHYYHQECSDPWLEGSATCPKCRGVN